MNKSEHVNFRLTQEQAATLRRIQRVYQLPSLSEAARRVIQAVAVERGLTTAREESTQEESYVEA